MLPNPLTQVVTIREASSLFDRHPDTIKYHIIKGQLESRLVDTGNRALYLISLESLIKRYGKPKNSPSRPEQMRA